MEYDVFRTIYRMKKKNAKSAEDKIKKYHMNFLLKKKKK